MEPEIYLTIYTDGTFIPHNKKMAIGCISKKFEIGKQITHKVQSSTISEYLAILEAVKTAIQYNIPCSIIKSDCKIAIDELSNQKPITHPPHQDIYFKIHALIQSNKLKIKFQHLDRGKNIKAHKIAIKALS